MRKESGSSLDLEASAEPGVAQSWLLRINALLLIGLNLNITLNIPQGEK